MHTSIRRCTGLAAALARRSPLQLLAAVAFFPRQAVTVARLPSKGAAGHKSLKPAGWYGAFSEGESTYDDGAVGTASRGVNPEVMVNDGWNPDVGGKKTNGLPAATFHESPSAAGVEAWQTHYPAVSTGVGMSNGGEKNGAWFRGRGGSWEQEYKSSKNKGRSADWFDNQVMQRDGYGRLYEPYADSGRRFILWQERAVNTTLACPTSGCVANTTLQAFDGTTEQGTRCRFSLGVHATDFDCDTNLETVEWIIINGATVNTNCLPRVNGCSANGGGQVPIYPCVADLDITSLVPWSGSLQIAAKISDTVDECPYEGNLLSAVPIVTCMVQQQDPSPLYGNAPNSPTSIYDTGSQQTSTGITGVSSDGSYDPTAATSSSSTITDPNAASTLPSGADTSAASNSDGSYDPAAAANSPYGPGYTGSPQDVPFGVIPGLNSTAPGTGVPSYPFGSLTSPISANWQQGPTQEEAAAASAAASEAAAAGEVSTMIGSSVWRAVAPLSCFEPGCTAWVNMQINQTAAQSGTCTLTIVGNMTDFDNSESVELVQYVSVDGTNMTFDINPGKNPCDEQAQGTPMTAAEMVYVLLQDVDVTTQAQDGGLMIQAKISPAVDECPSNGFLLNGIAQVDCVVPTTTNDDWMEAR